MSWNGSGTFTRQFGSSGWANDKAAGTKIVASRHDTNDDDLATGINNCLTKDGQNEALADLPMGNHKHTAVADATSLDEYASALQVMSSEFQWLTGVAGVDTITASRSIVGLSIAAGQVYRFVPAGANTSVAPTLNIDSTGGVVITKSGTAQLIPGDIPANAVVEVCYDGTRFQLLRAGSDAFQRLRTISGAGTNAITCVSAPVISAYTTGMFYTFLPDGTNTGATTINISGVGVANIVRPGGIALSGGELVTNQVAAIFYDGTDWQLLNANGLSRTSTTSLSGATGDISNVPATAKRVTVLLNGASLSGGANAKLQLGVSGTPETSGYLGAEGRVISGNTAVYAATSTSGFDAQVGGNTRLFYGSFVLENISGNNWLARWSIWNDAGFVSNGQGYKPLAGTLDSLRLTTTGADTYDAGTVALMYE